MQSPFIGRRKKFTFAAIVAAALLAGGAAFAFFAATGTGTGSANTGKATSLVIEQIGAGYDSLVSSTGTYTQDQAFFGADTTSGLIKVGDRVSLAGTTGEQLVTVVVAIHNWTSNAVTHTLTFTITTTVDGRISATATTTFPAAPGRETPSTTDVVFEFATQGAIIDHTFTYTISGLNGTSLNLALSNSYADTAVGTDTTLGYLYVEAVGPGWTTLAGDFPLCSVTPPIALGSLVKVNTDCGSSAHTNPGAYGTPSQVETTGNADIPAVEVNVVGGVVSSLFPGGPAQPVGFAIHNKGASTVKVATVATAVTKVTVTADAPTVVGHACATTTYVLSPTPDTVSVNADIHPGSTKLFDAASTISMPTRTWDQNNCEGAVVKLKFTSN